MAPLKLPFGYYQLDGLRKQFLAEGRKKDAAIIQAACYFLTCFVDGARRCRGLKDEEAHLTIDTYQKFLKWGEE